MLTVVAFLVALGLLIAVHEYGHYRVAVACDVRVLRFAVGFGKVLFRWKARRPRPGQDTEFVICAFPLGGYVRMLDEREAPVDPAERDRAFNHKPLRQRAAIVAAGPAANLLLAVLLYAGVHWYGTQEPEAVLASPVAGSLAERAGLKGGERVLGVLTAPATDAAATQGGGAPAAVPGSVRSFEDLRWQLTRAALEGDDLLLLVSEGAGGRTRELRLALSELDVREADASLLRRIGIAAPWTRPQIGEVSPQGAAAQAGLRQGDLVLSVDGTPIVDGMQLRERIRASGAQGEPREQAWLIERDGQRVSLQVTPQRRSEGERSVGRIGAYVGSAPAMVEVQHDLLDGLWLGVERTWDVSVLTLRMLGRMLVGEASIKNLSGPLTIADYAGKSASLGLVQYLGFLALISVSLGVLNLLPLPVLDGGHLMYYFYEAVRGKPLSDAWMDRLQRGGVAILLLMMSIALFNDVTRLLG